MEKGLVCGTKDFWYVMIIEPFHVHPPKTIYVPAGIVRAGAKCSVYRRCFLFEILKCSDLKSPLKPNLSYLCPLV